MAEQGITKSEIVRNIANKFPQLFIKNVQQVVDIVFDEMSQALAQERRVELRGFGAFSVRRRSARKARNPRTNSVVSLGTRYTPYFRAGKELRDRLNPQQ